MKLRNARDVFMRSMEVRTRPDRPGRSPAVPGAGWRWTDSLPNIPTRKSDSSRILLTVNRLIVHRHCRSQKYLFAVMTFGLLLSARPARAQTDEIQVYDGGLAAPGIFNLTWHNNFTPRGLPTPAFAGAVVADRSWNGVPEWAYGVTRWFEAGLYMPLYTLDKNTGWGLDGFKLRALFAVPDADHRAFFYGANFEFSCNARRWDQNRFTSEIRPIIGWHRPPFDFIVNPIVDTAYDGFKNLEFVPATRIAYNPSTNWAIAAEEYDDFGPLRGFLRKGDQVHQFYAVVDRTGGLFDVEVGIGFGLTAASDGLTLKLILSRDLNQRPLRPSRLVRQDKSNPH
jgi:hypothetical protein